MDRALLCLAWMCSTNKYVYIIILLNYISLIEQKVCIE